MCNGFGTDGTTVIGLLAVCAVLSPILIPAAGVYAVAAGGYAVASYTAEKTRQARERRRTTNVVKKLKNRYIKRLKAGEWQAYLQEVFDRAQQEPSQTNLHELGVAMLLADDAAKALQYLSAALETEARPRSSGVLEPSALRGRRVAEIRFARGITHQTLRNYDAAAADFAEAAKLLEAGCCPSIQKQQSTRECPAPAPKQQLPQLSMPECLNSLGYSLYLRALYEIMRSDDVAKHSSSRAFGWSLPAPAVETVNALLRSPSFTERVGEARHLLQLAISNYDRAIALVADEPRGMFLYNRGHAKYHLALLSALSAGLESVAHADRAWALPSADSQLLVEALRDFDLSVTLSNFGTTAEGHAMRAQALTVLGRGQEAQLAAETADRMDPKVFLVDLRSPEQLMAPWPLPPAPHSGKMHDFEPAGFGGPHFCDHCLGFIKNPMGAYRCKCCGFRVHRACLAKARKMQSCWKVSGGIPAEHEEGHAEADADVHVHQMRSVIFPLPSRCDACSEYIKSMSGYQCIECKYRCHENCIDSLKNCVILEDESSCLTC